MSFCFKEVVQRSLWYYSIIINIDIITISSENEFEAVFPSVLCAHITGEIEQQYCICKVYGIKWYECTFEIVKLPNKRDLPLIPGNHLIPYPLVEFLYT